MASNATAIEMGGLEVVGGNLRIELGATTSLVDFSALHDVGGALDLSTSPAAESADATLPARELHFEKLASASSVTLSSLAGVDDLSWMSHLQRVDHLTVRSANDLQRVALDELQQVQTLEIASNENLASIRFTKLVAATVLNLENLPALRELALPALRSIAAVGDAPVDETTEPLATPSLSIFDVPALEEIALVSLESVAGRLLVDGADKLKRVDLPQLASVGALSLNPLTFTARVDAAVAIAGGEQPPPQATAFEVLAIPKLESIDGDLAIRGPFGSLASLATILTQEPVRVAGKVEICGTGVANDQLARIFAPASAYALEWDSSCRWSR